MKFALVVYILSGAYTYGDTDILIRKTLQCEVQNVFLIMEAYVRDIGRKGHVFYWNSITQFPVN